MPTKNNKNPARSRQFTSSARPQIKKRVKQNKWYIAIVVLAIGAFGAWRLFLPQQQQITVKQRMASTSAT